MIEIQENILHNIFIRREIKLIAEASGHIYEENKIIRG